MCDVIAAELLVDGVDLGITDGLAPRSAQQGPRFCLRGGEVHRLDRLLRSTAHRRVDLPEGAKLLTATTDLSVVVAAEEEALHIDGPRRLRLEVAFADSATFLSSGDLLVAAASAHRSVFPDGWEVLGRDDNRALVVDPQTGDIVAEAPLGVSAAVVLATPHPRDGSVLLGAYGGQSFSELFVARQQGEDLVIDFLLRDVGDVAFDPEGTSLLIAPNPSNENVARAVAWPGLEEKGRIEGDIDSPDGSALGESGVFLGKDLILLPTVDGPTLLCSSRLKPLAEIGPAGSPLAAGHRQILGLEEDVFAVRAWMGGERSASVWRLPRDESFFPPLLGGPGFWGDEA